MPYSSSRGGGSSGRSRQLSAPASSNRSKVAGTSGSITVSSTTAQTPQHAKQQTMQSVALTGQRFASGEQHGDSASLASVRHKRVVPSYGSAREAVTTATSTNVFRGNGAESARVRTYL